MRRRLLAVSAINSVRVVEGAASGRAFVRTIDSALSCSTEHAMQRFYVNRKGAIRYFNELSDELLGAFLEFEATLL
jgi:hypothetical protein